MNKFLGKADKTPEKGNNVTAALPSVIGSPFHNPYTFIPFPNEKKPPLRQEPVPITIDEFDADDRVTGVLELEVTTISPLLTQEPLPYKGNDGEHKWFHAMSIENDVVVSATGIRGALRTLMTIISGGTLGYLDRDVWLCQGRDLQLGPAQTGKAPKNIFLCEVVEPGNSQHGGTIRIGESRLIPTRRLIELFKKFGEDLEKQRPTKGTISPFWIDNPDHPQSLSKTPDDDHLWKLKLSGKKVNPHPMYKDKKTGERKEGTNREGCFKPGDQILSIPARLWSAYQGLNRYGAHSQLEKGDLVWLEPVSMDLEKITEPAHIKSLQWARWGREGVALGDALPPHVLPDSLRNDGCVDIVTELFGQIPMVGCNNAAGPFAGRIRPHNLIFFDGMSNLEKEVTLAPLSSPHPGCMAFYRDADNLDNMNKKSGLKGYKVYRNTTERGDSAPWRYEIQGVYDNTELKQPAQQKVNKTVDLVKEGQKGRLRIAFRALNKDEMALLLAACSVDWKLGGGKPLGLGHCRVTSIRLINEDGEAQNIGIYDEKAGMKLPDKYEKLITAAYADRIKLYKASQVPVDKLRYPRAVNENLRREGLVWFGRHAAPKKQGNGYETIWTKDPLRKKVANTQIRAQCLPRLSVENPMADALFGYDCIELETEQTRDKRTLVGKIEPFVKGSDTLTGKPREENTSLNRETRQQHRNERE